jgi:hypothetical protein
VERVRLVAFYVFSDASGMRLEVAVQCPSARVVAADYGDLTVAELVQVVEATLEKHRPGDLVDPAGWVQPPLFR